MLRSYKITWYGHNLKRFFTYKGMENWFVKNIIGNSQYYNLSIDDLRNCFKVFWKGSEIHEIWHGIV